MQRTSTPRGRHAFTLIELLVVVAIIALLIAILLPSLGRARERTRRLTCGTNLRGIAQGMLMYASNNNDTFANVSNVGASHDADVLWWTGPAGGGGDIDFIALHGIGPYIGLGKGNYKILICPSDDITKHKNYPGNNCYPFSFSFNWAFSCSPHSSFAANNEQKQYSRVSQVKNQEAILAYEESESTIDDFIGTPWHNGASYLKYINLASGRHDAAHMKVSPDTVSSAGAVPNGNALSDVAFIDGHVEFVSRKVTHLRIHSVGNPADFAGSPDPTFP